MVLNIFLWGALSTVPVFFIQIGLTYLLTKIELTALTHSLIYWFLVIALSEELFKYFVVKSKVLNSSALDEPVDIMIYMVIAALGFSALENILYLLSPINVSSFDSLISRILIISIIRFLGATFLHTLCSAVIGYFMALSFCNIKKGFTSIAWGIGLAVLLHGLYDFSIMTLDGSLQVVIPVLILLTLAAFVFSGFEKLKELKSVCEIKI